MTAQREQILQLYKTKVNLPILQAHDDAEYDEAASKWLYTFQCRVRDFCPNRLVHGWNVLEVSFGHEEWAFIKLTGRWPLWNFPPLVGTEILTSCPLCGARDVSVTHVLKACRGTLQLFLRSGLCGFHIKNRTYTHILNVSIPLLGWGPSGHSPYPLCGLGGTTCSFGTACIKMRGNDLPIPFGGSAPPIPSAISPGAGRWLGFTHEQWAMSNEQWAMDTGSAT